MTPRLEAEVDVDGFRAVLPGPLLGSNSTWVLVFVAAWWGAFGGVCALLDGTLGSDWIAVEVQLGGFLVGMMGWAVGWPVFDRWSTRFRRVPIEATYASLVWDGEVVSWSAVERVQTLPSTVQLRMHERPWIDLRPHRLTGEERRWLGERLEELHARFDHDGEAPSDIERLATGAKDRSGRRAT